MRDFRSILLLLLFCIAGLAVFGHAHAENVSINQSYVVVQESPSYAFHPTYRIQQGDLVYVNDTIDISGQGWGTGVAWYGRYGEYAYPQYIREFTGYRLDVMKFYIDPTIFSERPGIWYQYYGNTTERNGNLVAFKVVAGYRNETMTLQNGTVIEKSVGVSNVSMEKPIREVIVPEIPVADFLVARGDPLDTGFSKIWVFGRAGWLYDVAG